MQYFSCYFAVFLFKRYCSISAADVCCCFSWLYFALPGGANSESQHARNSLCAVLLSNSEYFQFFQTIFQENTLKYFYEYFIDIKICQILNHVQTHSQREKRCHFFCSYFFCHSSLIFSNMKHEESSQFFDRSPHNSGHHPNFFASNIQPKHSALKIKVH